MVLVDTGAQVKLVRTGLFSDIGRPAHDPVRLQTVGGQLLGGGTRTLGLDLHLVANDYGTSETYTHVVTDDFYIADITCDVILSYPFLRSRNIGVIPHRRRLLWEHDWGWTWLRGGHGTLSSSPPSHWRDIGTTTLAPWRSRPRRSAWFTCDYAVRSDLVDLVVQRFGGNVPTVDAFASRQNKRFPKFWDIKKDAFSKDWSTEDLLWINPPFDKIEEVVHKLETDGATGIIVVPEWKDTGWRRKLQRLVVDSYIFNKEEPIFLREGVVLMKPPLWRTWAFLVHGALVPPPLHFRRGLAHYMRAWPDAEAGKLTFTEIGLIGRQCDSFVWCWICGANWYQEG